MNRTLRSYLTLLQLLISVCYVRGDTVQRFPSCVYHHSNSARLSVLPGDEEPVLTLSSVTDDQGRRVNITTCRKSTDFCYTFWKDPSDNHPHPIIISQGCWESSSRMDCNRSACLALSKTSKVLHQSRFCCCSGDLCNLRVGVDSLASTEFLDPTIQTHDSLSQTVPSSSQQGPSVEIVVIVISVAIVAVAIVTSAVFVFQTCIKSKWNKASIVASRNSTENQSQPLIDGLWLDSVKLLEVIGQGRYGTVWKASLGDNYVAVKIFSAPSRSYYYNEREIYSLPFLEHPNIIGYLGCDEYIPTNGHTEYRLVLEYAPCGSLQEYLRQNSVDWPTLCKMGRSVARGLAHLHTDFHRGDQKLCIAHRDVNSRNVLVKADLTCCLCDLGFAMQMSGAHYYYNGEEQHAETNSLCDVGTLRYMSPEVLEGAVNLRECESSLKQIDVYSLGLVLWEIAYRCHDLYVTKEAPPYLLPFEEETGPHPTLELMKTLVCRQKARPLMPETWRDNCASARLLKATLEDAWDQDAEARLTSLCVEERWAELPALWEREKHKGLNQSVHTNPCNPVQQTEQSIIHQTAHPHSPHSHHRSDADAQNRDYNLYSLGNTSNSETYDLEMPSKKNSSVVWPSSRPLQPHQGRNPCMERNTCDPPEEFSVSGNALVDRSVKHMRTERAANTRLESASSDGPSSSSGYNNHSRVVNPIPYVQNAVRESSASHISPGVSEEPTRSLGKFLSGIFRSSRNKSKRSSPCPESGHWEEHQRLCPTLSSPSDAENPLPKSNASVKTKSNNQLVAPKATQVCWEDQGISSVSLIKSSNISINLESVQTTACSIASNDESVFENDATSGLGVTKIQASPNYGSPQQMRRQETKSTAISSCDKSSGVIDEISSEFSKPRLLSTQFTPTNL